MSNAPDMSPLSLIVLYGKLRRFGANRETACKKLRGLIHQLSPADDKELTKRIDDWEVNWSKRAATGSLPVMPDDEAPTAASSSRYIFGMSEYDRMSAERGSSALRPLHGAIACPTCGELTDMNEEICKQCGNLLDEYVAKANRADTKGQTRFGPTSTLKLAINGTSDLLDAPIGSSLTLGRRTRESTQVDVDLTDYRAETLGVSRAHASIKRQRDKLVLIDLHSTNHTYLNGKQLADDEVCTLTSGDEVFLGELGFRVIYRTEPESETTDEPPTLA